MAIHPTVIINPTAEIGNEVSIGPYTVVEGNVFISEGVQIGSNVLVGEGARIGKGCKIYHGAVVSNLPQDLKFGGEKTTLEIGENTIVREYATLHRGTTAHWKTVIGSNCLLMAYVHVAHDCIIGNNVIIANACNLAGHVTIEDHVGIGGMTPVHQFCKIGEHSFIGGGYRVPKDVPPYIRAMGEPLTYAGLNTVGLSRRGFSEAQLVSLKKAFKLIYHSGLNTSQAIEKIKTEVESTPEVSHLIQFIETSERGIIRG